MKMLIHRKVWLVIRVCGAWTNSSHVLLSFYNYYTCIIIICRIWCSQIMPSSHQNHNWTSNEPAQGRDGIFPGSQFGLRARERCPSSSSFSSTVEGGAWWSWLAADSLWIPWKRGGGHTKSTGAFQICVPPCPSISGGATYFILLFINQPQQFISIFLLLLSLESCIFLSYCMRFSMYSFILRSIVWTFCCGRPKQRCNSCQFGYIWLTYLTTHCLHI